MIQKRNFQKELTELLQKQDLSDKKRLLLHCCCAPCSSYVLEYLHPYFDITVFFYNPNITEEFEYKMRKQELIRYLSEVPYGEEIHRIDADYEPSAFFRIAEGYEDCPERGARCKRCFDLRLSETAKRAAEGNFDYFGTTLSISPHKDAELLMHIGEQYAKQYGVPFLPSDFKKRNGYKRSIELSKEYHLYRQDYCGCIYSKEAKMRGRKPAVLLSMLLLSLILLCVACTAGDQEDPPKSGDGKMQQEIFAMDTIMDLTVYGEGAEEAMADAVTLIQDLEQKFSVTKEKSDMARLNAAGGEKTSVSEDTYSLIEQCLNVSKKTDGLFDISIYPLVKAWGFTTDETHVPKEKEREQALSQVDYRKIKLLKDGFVQISQNMQLDLGAAGKGYLSQRLMELFQDRHVDSAIVSLGGNVQTIGYKPDGSEFVVGITDPSDGASVYGTLTVRDKAVVTSGIYQRYFEEDGVIYHHIMDKRTGMPAENNLSSVTVIADNGTEADALATALYVMGEKEAVKYQKTHPEIALILIRKDGSCWQSEGVNMTLENS